MPCNVICISGTDGAGGREVGGAVAAALGFGLVDEDIVLHAAREAGVEPRVVADAEQRKSVVARLLDDLGQGGQATAALGGFAPPAAEEASAPSADALRGLIRSAIEQTAARGSAVIVAHAASFALAGHESCLRVLVMASPETRRSRIAAERGVDEREAGKLVQRSDAGRAAYLKRFYGVGAELPTHYDLAISTDRLTTDAAAALVVSAATT